MSELKTQKSSASVAKFVASVPDKQKRADSARLVKIFEEVTKEKATMWGETGVGPRRKGAGPGPSRGRAIRQQANMRGPSIIGFGQYHYKSERSTQEGDWPWTGFSPRKQNMTLYIMSGFRDYKPLLKKLGKHTISGGSCVYFKRLDDLHIPTLRTLIKRSVVSMRRRYSV